jgi:cyclic pyranopterin monophosphate synthase
LADDVSKMPNSRAAPKRGVTSEPSAAIASSSARGKRHPAIGDERSRGAGATPSGMTHLDAQNRPTMVDVGAKEVTHRVATAEARVHFPANVAAALRKSGHRTKKGPVFDTAIIAGVMAAKRTHDLIPFCHPLPIDKCSIEIDARRSGEIVIQCQVSVHHRTGVEMEALTGATIAALTIYDMCKALSHDIEITSVRLVEKTGGKRDFKRKA